MGQNGRLVAEYAGSSKLLKRMSLIISGMNFGDMLDIAKWLRIAGLDTVRNLDAMTAQLQTVFSLLLAVSFLRQPFYSDFSRDRNASPIQSEISRLFIPFCP